MLDKPNWLSRKDIKKLDASGMTIGAHTWDHHRVDRYSGNDWRIQLKKPRAMLQKLIGKPVIHFAYPYGAWNQAALDHLAADGYRTAFQLETKPLDPKRPLLTLQRAMVNSNWSGADLLAHMNKMTKAGA